MARKSAQEARQSAREAHRASIRAAAEEVFVRAGFNAAKMAEIARAAGVAVGTLYNYFSSKEEIFGEILAHRCAEMRAALTAELQLGTPIENIRTLIRASLENLDRHGALFAVLVERGGVAEYDLERLAGQLAQREYQRFLAIFTEVLRAGVQAGVLRRDVPVPTMVAALSGAMNGAAYAWLASRRRRRLSSFADDLITLFLAGAQVSP